MKKTRSAGAALGASAAAPPAANPSPQRLPRPPACSASPRSASAPRLQSAPPPSRRDPLLPSRPHRDASGAEEWGEDREREREEGKGGREREIQMWERDSEGGALGPHVTVIKKNRPLTPKLTVECKIIIGFPAKMRRRQLMASFPSHVGMCKLQEEDAEKDRWACRLPFWHCATTIVLHLKRTGGINGFSKAASQVIIGIEIPKPCCPVSSLTLFASNKKRLLYFTVLEANNFFLQKYLTKIDQTTISS